MVIKPKIRGFVCVTSHPEGCATHIKEQFSHADAQIDPASSPKKVLVIGSSTGYGLSSRIAAAAGGADTVGVFFERPFANGRPATAGWYNTTAFTEEARKRGLFVGNINGDAFSEEIKQHTLAMVKDHLGKVDLVVYSLASPRRTDSATGETFKSVLKPIGAPFTGKTVDTDKKLVHEVTLDPATDEDIHATVKVMGGEDWLRWMEALQSADLLADGVKTVAYSYIGPEVTWPIYKNGTIGKAKEDVEMAAKTISQSLVPLNGAAYVSVNKAVVTQASSAIPVVPLYISLLFKVMKEAGNHEGCIEQMVRLMKDHLYNPNGPTLDEDGRIRVDDWEMQEAIQTKVAELWQQVTSENLEDISDFKGYQSDFLKLFGFGVEGVDYEAPSDIEKSIE